MPKPKTGGRQKGTKNKNAPPVKKYAGKYTRESIEAIHVLGMTAVAEQVRMAAWKELLDRGCGRPAQAVEHAGPAGGALRLVVETGVPARLAAPTIIDHVPDVTHSVTHDEPAADKLNDVNGLDEPIT